MQFRQRDPTLRHQVLDVHSHPGSKGGFVEGSGGEAEDGLRGVLFGGRKAVAVHFEEQDADEKAGALVPIDKGVVADNAGGVCSSQLIVSGLSL